MSRLRKSEFLTVILLTVAITLFVSFDMSISRQVVGFLFFTFVPGIIAVGLLGLKKLSWSETVFLSAGFGLAFMMTGGLLINQAFSILGFAGPLSVLPLFIILTGFVVVGAVLASSKMSNIEGWNVKNLVHPTSILFAWVPILTVLGAYVSNAFGNNSILLLATIAIPLLFVMAVVSDRLAPSRLYPVIIFMIAISLLYRSSLMSDYLVSFGSDSHLEYFVFKTTLNSASWGAQNPYFWDEAYGRLNSMLSITVLPTVYSRLLNIDPMWTFKLLYPLFFSLVPVGLFQLWRKFFDVKFALLSAFLFMAEATFYNEMLGLNRQIVAEVFFALLLFVIFDDRMKSLPKTLCFLIFSVGLITSHYGLAEIFLFFIASAFAFLKVIRKTSKRITASMITFFIVAMFSWYLYTSGAAAFNSILGYGNYVLGQFGEFFNPASRGAVVLRGLGAGSAPSIWNAIHRVFVYSTEFLIVVGFLGLVISPIRKRVTAHLRSMDLEYVIFTVLAMALLGACILVPGFAATLNITRFYHILLFLLAPLCTLGMVVLITPLFKKRVVSVAVILMLVILVPYFLFQTGFIFEITRDDSWSIPLSKYRMDAFRLDVQLGYIEEQDAFSAQWLSGNIDINKTGLFSDAVSRGAVLLNVGVTYRSDVQLLVNSTQTKIDGVVYLSNLNVINGIVVGDNFLWNTTEFSSSFSEMNEVYCNGGSEICAVPSASP